MNIAYSPYYTFRVYTGSSPISIGQKHCADAMLLQELELRLGMSHSQKDIEEARVEAYYDIMQRVITSSSILYQSFQLDANLNDKRVTKNILQWRDTLIMAGWNKTATLPGPKLDLIGQAEKQIPADSIIFKGEADSWLRILDADITGLAEPIDIEVHCPKELIYPLILKVLEKFNAQFVGDTSTSDSEPANVKIYSAEEVRTTYEWLACQTPLAGQVVACADQERLDSVLRSFGKLKACDARVGCHELINNPCAMVAAPDTLVWLDCYGDYGVKYPYGFLNATEINDVTKNCGCQITSHADMLAAAKKHLLASLSKAHSLILVRAERDTGSILPEHPVVTELKSKGVAEHPINPSGLVSLAAPQPEVRFAQQPEYKLPDTDAYHQPVVMSYSSLEQIMQSPFDFATERQAHLYEMEEEDEIRTLKGNVAHKVVETMVNEGKLTIDAYDNIFKAVTGMKEYALLMKAENLFELEDLRLNLKNSLVVLLDIIKQNNLQVVASEMSIPDPESGVKGVNISSVIGDCKGNIDLVLKNDKAEYFIFDFKYSTSHTHPDKLAENKSVQFEVYRRLFDQHSGLGKVKAMGYYLFPKCTLYMSEADYNSSGFKPDHIEVITLDKALANVWHMIEQSFSYRKDQLQGGLIEEGEQQELLKLQYHQDMENHKSLFPLKKDYQTATNKSGGYSPKHIVLKNQIR